MRRVPTVEFGPPPFAAMAATDALDLPAACQRVAALLGTDHPSYRALLATTGSKYSPPPATARMA